MWHIIHPPFLLGLLLCFVVLSRKVNSYETVWKLLTNTGDGQSNFGEYELTSAPVEFGKTGAKSYLVDPYGVHVTKENCPATQENPGRTIRLLLCGGTSGCESPGSGA